MGNGTQDQQISLIVLLALSESPLFLGLMGHEGWISQEELTPHPLTIDRKSLPYSGPKHAHFPVGWYLAILGPLPGG